MADLAPFRAWRYDFRRVGPASTVLAPPYDVISHTHARELAEQSPYQVIHLILGKPAPDRAFGPDDYERAADTWNAWRREGVLIQEERPALYVYDIEFSDLVTGERVARRGVLGALKLEPFEKGIVRPHEEVFPGPLTDRISLMRACDAVLSPVFGLHDDPRGAASSELAAAACEPFLETLDSDGCLHRVRRVLDPDAIRAFCDSVSRQPITIADGHHRYTAALEYARRMGRLGGEGPGSRTMVCLTATDDPGLRAYGTHRMFAGLGGPPSLEPLRELAHVEPLGHMDAREAMEIVESAPVGQPTYVFATRDGLYRVCVEHPSRVEHLLDGVHEVLRSEGLTILHRALLVQLGLGTDAIDVTGGVSYTRDAAEALQSVRSGLHDLAVLVRAPGGEELATVCSAGQRLPHKSTYFYPKLLSGCVFLDLSE